MMKSFRIQSHHHTYYHMHITMVMTKAAWLWSHYHAYVKNDYSTNITLNLLPILSKASFFLAGDMKLSASCLFGKRLFKKLSRLFCKTASKSACKASLFFSINSAWKMMSTKMLYKHNYKSLTVLWTTGSSFRLCISVAQFVSKPLLTHKIFVENIFNFISKQLKSLIWIFELTQAKANLKPAFEKPIPGIHVLVFRFHWAWLFGCYSITKPNLTAYIPTFSSFFPRILLFFALLKCTYLPTNIFGMTTDTHVSKSSVIPYRFQNLLLLCEWGLSTTTPD